MNQDPRVLGPASNISTYFLAEVPGWGGERRYLGIGLNPGILYHLATSAVLFIFI